MKKFLSFVFSKEFWLNRWTIGVLSVVIVLSAMAFSYLKNPAFIPQPVRVLNKNVVDALLGKDLAEKIDETRDLNGATSIRALFNLNKEENLEKHCEKKEEKGKEQEKCYKTYKNEEFGFSVEYPVGWANKEIKNNMVSFYPADKEISNDYRGDIILYAKSNPNSLDIKSFYDGQNDVDLFSDAAGGYNEFTIDGFRAIKFNNVQGLVNTTVVVIVYDNKFIEVEDWGEKHLEDGIFDTIVNSFKND